MDFIDIKILSALSCFDMVDVIQIVDEVFGTEARHDLYDWLRNEGYIEEYSDVEDDIYICK